MTDFSKLITFSREDIDKKLEYFYLTIKCTFGAASLRTVKLMKMYEELEPRLRSAPASSQVHFHYASPGGYLFHVCHVIDAAIEVSKLYGKLGGTLDFEHAELVFAAMHHDLGKLGDEDGPAYIKESDQYWIKKGYTHKYNEEVQKMSYDDRTVYLLNKYGVQYTKKELLGMKMADGLFSEANKEYFQAKGVFPMKTSLGHIIHWADWMAANAEKDEQRILCEGA